MAMAALPEIKAELSGIIQEFLLDIGYEFPLLKLYPAVEGEVKRHFRNNGFSDEFVSKIKPQIKTGIGIATTTFQTTPLQHTMHRSPVLERMGEFLSSFHSIFGQFAGDMIIKDSLQFISACYAEAESENIQFPAEAHLFPSYFRLKVGVAEAYSFMLFPTAQFSEAECLRYCLPLIPYLTLAFNWINDIMSFYKEIVQMENCNFVTNSARCKGLTETEFLRKLCDDTSDVIRTLRTLGKAHPGLSKAVEAFVSGYVVYHLTQTRYRMKDLNLTFVSDARERLNASIVSGEQTLHG
ncbi:hypothetical protein HAV15_009452 [Penicillium sp. str. |nr:hypothetical protein HAV15_009452 [Penicillium sp. str. \